MLTTHVTKCPALQSSDGQPLSSIWPASMAGTKPVVPVKRYQLKYCGHRCSGICAVQYGESVDVADWFSGFCAVHDSSDGSPEEEAQAAVVPKLKKRRGRPSKKVLQRVWPSAEIALCYLAHTLCKSTIYKISLTVECACRLQCTCKAESELCHKRQSFLVSLVCTCTSLHCCAQYEAQKISK